MLLRSTAATILGLVAFVPHSRGEEVEPVPVSLSEAEKAFTQAMSDSVLVGRFTAGGEAAPKPERYEIGEVRKLAAGKWMIQARIKYGDHDVTLPLTLPVEFAGDTAVIVVDKIGFPGLGVYSARVLIHGGRYAGYWQGVGHGGHLFGAIEKADKGGPSKDQPVEPAAG